MFLFKAFFDSLFSLKTELKFSLCISGECSTTQLYPSLVLEKV